MDARVTASTGPAGRRRPAAFAAGAALGALARAAAGPDALKPVLFLPDVVLAALLAGLVGLALASRRPRGAA